MKKYWIVGGVVVAVLLLVSVLVWVSGLGLYGLALSRGSLRTDKELFAGGGEDNIEYFRAVVLQVQSDGGYLLGTDKGLRVLKLSAKTGKMVVIDGSKMSRYDRKITDPYLQSGQLREEVLDANVWIIMGEGEVFDQLMEKGSLVEFYYDKGSDQVTTINLLKINFYAQ